MRLIWVMVLTVLQSTSFKAEQMQHARVKTAYAEKDKSVQQYFRSKNLSFTGFNLFLRVFKKEGQLEVWVKEKGANQFVLLHTYEICASSGVLGPKRKEGDLQVPEGVYQINHFNPVSNFHLSLGINYPNASDKILGDRKNPGSAIYIHGNCVTIGCIPITDEVIKEVYVLAVEAKTNGQTNIPVHIFPTHLDDAGMKQLQQSFPQNNNAISFWKNLQVIFQDFEASKKLKTIHVNKKGEYYF
jgi:murein L,D-transpeptidase YafK